MREFKKRRNGREDYTRLLIRLIWAVLLFAVSIFMMRAAWGMYGKLAEASRGQEATALELATAQAQEIKVRASVDDLSSDRGVEAQVRKRFGYVKPGEGKIAIVRQSTTTTLESRLQVSWWQRIIQILFVW